MCTLSLPCLSYSLHTHTYQSGRFSPPCSFIFTPHRRSHSHFLTPCSSLRQRERESKKQLGKINTAPSESGLKRLFSPNNNKTEVEGDADADADADLDFQDGTALKGTLLAGLLLLGVVGGFASVGYIYKDQVNSFLNHLSVFIEGLFYVLLSFLVYLSLSHHHSTNQVMVLLDMHYSLPFMLDWRYHPCIILYFIPFSFFQI